VGRVGQEQRHADQFFVQVVDDLFDVEHVGVEMGLVLLRNMRRSPSLSQSPTYRQDAMDVGSTEPALSVYVIALERHCNTQEKVKQEASIHQCSLYAVRVSHASL